MIKMNPKKRPTKKQPIQQMDFLRTLLKKKFTKQQISARIDRAIKENVLREKYFAQQEAFHKSSDPAWAREMREEREMHSNRIKKLQIIKQRALQRNEQKIQPVTQKAKIAIVKKNNKAKKQIPKKINYSSAKIKNIIRETIRKKSFMNSIIETELFLSVNEIRDERSSNYSTLQSRIRRDFNNKISGDFYRNQINYYRFLLREMKTNFPKSPLTSVIEKEVTNLINSL